MLQDIQHLPARTTARTGAAPAPDFPRLVGEPGWRRLHADVRRRFGPGHGGTEIRYRGHMDVHRSTIGLVFAALAMLIGGPLPLRRGDCVPTDVGVWDDRAGGIVWERNLHLRPGAPPACIRSTKRHGPDGSLLECVDGGLGMVLTVFEDSGALVFESRRFFLRLSGLRIPLPSLFTPGRCRVTHAAITPNRFRFTMEMAHPVWGRTFHQSGIFHDPEVRT